MSVSVTPIVDGNLRNLAVDLDRLSEIESQMYGTGLAGARMAEELTGLGFTAQEVTDAEQAPVAHFAAIKDLRRAISRLENIRADLIRLQTRAARVATHR